MRFRTFFYTAFLLLTAQQTLSQRNYQGHNFLGLTGGLVLFDIKTSDFVTKQTEGFTAGFTSRGSFYNNFDLIYGIGFYGAEIAVQANNLLGTDPEYVDYGIQMVQVKFLGSYNIINNHLSLDAGPILSINGKMKLKNNRYEDYLLEGPSDLRASDVQDISKVNFHLMGGISGGFENFRLSAQYQYGVTNMLNKLNDQGLGKDDFKGHASLITFAAIVYF